MNCTPTPEAELRAALNRAVQSRRRYVYEDDVTEAEAKAKTDAAAAFFMPGIQHAILEGADVNVDLSLHAAAELEYPHAVAAILNAPSGDGAKTLFAKDRIGCRPLEIAIQRGCVETVRTLVKAEAKAKKEGLAMGSATVTTAEMLWYCLVYRVPNAGSHAEIAKILVHDDDNGDVDVDAPLSVFQSALCPRTLAYTHTAIQIYARRNVGGGISPLAAALLEANPAAVAALLGVGADPHRVLHFGGGGVLDAALTLPLDVIDPDYDNMTKCRALLFAAAAWRPSARCTWITACLALGFMAATAADCAENTANVDEARKRSCIV